MKCTPYRIRDLLQGWYVFLSFMSSESKPWLTPEWFISVLWSPRQVIHLLPVWDILPPLAYTPDRKDRRLLVSPLKALAKWGKRNCQSFKVTISRFEPRNPGCQSCTLTTAPQRPTTADHVWPGCPTTVCTCVIQDVSYVTNWMYGNLIMPNL